MSNKPLALTATVKNISLPEAEIKNFCQRWHIRELALFGSVLRDDFRPDSDLDVLVTFEPEANWGLFDHLQMKEELGQLLKREIDLLTRQAVERSHNVPRRQAILSSAQTVYVSR